MYVGLLHHGIHRHQCVLLYMWYGVLHCMKTLVGALNFEVSEASVALYLIYCLWHYSLRAYVSTVQCPVQQHSQAVVHTCFSWRDRATLQFIH